MKKSRILGATNICLMQVQFTDVPELPPFHARIVDSTQTCVMFCAQNPICKSVVVKALATGALCQMNSRNALDSEFRYLGEGSGVNYIQLLEFCPNDHQIISLNDVPRRGNDSPTLQTKIIYPINQFPSWNGQYLTATWSQWSGWTQCRYTFIFLN